MAAGLNDLQRRYQSRAGFLFVYIAEAHAADEWPMGDPIVTGRPVQQPVTVAQRITEARHFAQHFSLRWPLAVDAPELGDPFMRVYSPWPTRFYVLREGKLQFIAQPNEEHMYELAAVELALANAVGEQQEQ